MKQLRLLLTDGGHPSISTGLERVLGVAIDPRDQRLFVNADQNDDTLVVSYEMDNGVAVLDSIARFYSLISPTWPQWRKVHLTALEAIDFVGDGGGSNGWDAQDTSKLLGAILRDSEP